MSIDSPTAERGTTRPGPATIAGWCAALALGAAGLLGLASAFAPAALAAVTPQVMVFFSGSGQGLLEECGCTRFPLGGLDRRAGMIREQRRRWPRTIPVALEIGNFTDLPSPGGLIKSRGIVRAMNRLGYAASGIGERELHGGYRLINEIMAEAYFPFVSTNLVRARTGATWLQSNALLHHAGVRIGVLAVTRHNPALRMALPDGDMVVTVDPVMALQSQVARMRNAADVVVVLAALPIEDARVLARRVPGIDVILGAHGGRVTNDPVVEGFTQICYAGEDGKYLGRLDVYHPRATGPVSLEPDIVMLDEAVPPEPLMGRMVAEVMAQVADLERQHRPAEADARAGFLGAAACAPCHAPIVAEWARSDHARALQTLARKGPVQSSCVSCHVTGHGQPGGFTSPAATPHLAGVSCEACHGPGAAHVAQPARPYGRTTLATCTSCHTAEMDPTFNYYEDRQLVRHSSSDR